MNPTRRQMMLETLFGSGLIGLRALATGLPISFLLNPRKALADAGPSGNPNTPQYLIFSTSGNGDPVNTNAPGTYNVAGSTQPVHPTGTGFAAVSTTLGGKSYTTATPWASLQQYNPCFFHHGTYTVVHPDEHSVLGLQGATKTNDMLVSILASQLAPALGTIQVQPLSIGGGGAAETLSYQGAPQANLTPSSLRTMLIAPGGALEQLQKIRDTDLNALNAWAKTEGNSAQKSFIDQYAQSQVQARQISQTLLNNLTNITSNSVANQIAAAIALIQMNVTPVIAIHIPFGGDNHVDPGLAGEMAQTISGVASIVSLQQQLATTYMPDGVTLLSTKVSFAMLNVFGRNLLPPNLNGRGHLGNHHCSVLMGPAFKSSVIGGVEPFGSDFRAQAIEVSTGGGVHQGDASTPNTVAFSDTLASMAMTLGQGLGVDSSFMSTNITSAVPNGTSQPIGAALVKGA
jgi:hypothetical protein